MRKRLSSGASCFPRRESDRSHDAASSDCGAKRKPGSLPGRESRAKPSARRRSAFGNPSELSQHIRHRLQPFFRVFDQTPVTRKSSAGGTGCSFEMDRDRRR